MKEISVNSYNELIEQIERISAKKSEYCKFFYRGHANKDWKLIPTLLRNPNAQEDKELSEILNCGRNEESKIALAIAQHYGRKTRCLDFTRNYKVALYFACNPNSSAYNSDGAIIILKSSYHKPEWFTNYLVYYAAIDSRNDISSWDYTDYILQKNEIINEFIRTGRSLKRDDVNNQIQTYLSKGFMVDFEDKNYGVERINKQKAALYYFGSKFYSIENGKKVYADVDYISTNWSNGNEFKIELHSLSDPNLEERRDCTKIIIPQQLKKEIFKRIDIKPSDLGL